MSRKLTRVAVLGVLLCSALAFGMRGVPEAHAAVVDGSGATATGPLVSVSTVRTPDSPAHCAALLRANPALARNPQGCFFTVTTTVIVKQAGVRQAGPTPDLVCTTNCTGGGGCVGYNPPADVIYEQTATGSLSSYVLEQDTEFIGNGCSTPGFGIHHCYPNFTTPGTSVSVTYCDTSTDPASEAIGHAGFWVSQAGFGFSASIDSYMPSQMNNWYSNCAPMNCN